MGAAIQLLFYKLEHGEINCQWQTPYPITMDTFYGSKKCLP
jgi:hypothetical protein